MCLAFKIVSPRLIANRSELFQIGANLRTVSRDLWPASVHKGQHWQRRRTYLHRDAPVVIMLLARPRCAYSRFKEID